MALAGQCTPVPTGFCVGALLFLPSSAGTFAQAEPHFPAFHVASGDDADVGEQEVSARTFEGVRGGVVLGTGYSREREGNTHAEANALTKFKEKMQVVTKVPPTRREADATGIQRDSLGKEVSSPEISPEAILRDAWIYTTLEPCSVRTSGLPSCTAAILRDGVRRVYMVCLALHTGSACTD